MSAALDLEYLTETELLDWVRSHLQGILGPPWVIRSQDPPGHQFDAAWEVRGPDGRTATFVVEVKRQAMPATVERTVIPRLEQYVRALAAPATAVLVSPWLSPRTRQVLEAHDIGYLDATGNISLRVPDPAIVIRTEGDQRDPLPKSQTRRGISGPRAGRIIRELVDFREPRRPGELAAAAHISESYASRLLDVLSDEALIRRRKGSVITKIDWQGLLRARASSYDLIKANHVVGTVARRGIESTLEALRNRPADAVPVLMTGAMAANQYAPLVIGGALMLYIPPGPHIVDEVAKELGLLRASAGATVQLLQPMSEGAMDRPGPKMGGIPTVGLSQLALDCLGGPGRLPAAGEALIEWMETHESEWRKESPLRQA